MEMLSHGVLCQAQAFGYLGVAVAVEALFHQLPVGVAEQRHVVVQQFPVDDGLVLNLRGILERDRRDAGPGQQMVEKGGSHDPVQPAVLLPRATVGVEAVESFPEDGHDVLRQILRVTLIVAMRVAILYNASSEVAQHCNVASFPFIEGVGHVA